MGWQSYPFLVTPKELRTACEPFKLVVDNTCVPIDYTDTPIEVRISDEVRMHLPNLYCIKSKGIEIL